jgi:hypothetical protein
MRFLLVIPLGGLLLFTVPAAGQAQQRKPVLPSELQLALMVKSTLLAFNDANNTGNYSVLRDLASPEFQQANSAARLYETFRAERERKNDIAAIMVMNPTLRAAVDKQGVLQIGGFFPSRPLQVNFLVAYRAIDDRWRLHALGVVTADPSATTARNEPASRGSKPAQLAGGQNDADDIFRRHWPAMQAGPSAQDYAGYLEWASRTFPRSR